MMRMERFRTKWGPVRVKKTRQNKDLKRSRSSDHHHASAGVVLLHGIAMPPLLVRMHKSGTCEGSCPLAVMVRETAPVVRTPNSSLAGVFMDDPGFGDLGGA